MSLHIGTLLFAMRSANQSAVDSLAATVAYARAAEQHGFDEVWITEHHFHPTTTSTSAMALASYLLGATSRVRIGTGVAVLPNRHPVALAEEAAMLDLLSGGRFVLGVGRGQPTIDQTIFGRGLEGWQQDFAPKLDLLLRALAGTSADTTVPDLSVTPLPQSQPFPMAVACTSPTSAQVAAARGLPMLLPYVIPPSAKQELLTAYAAEATRYGHNPAQIQHYDSLIVQVDTSRAAALQVFDAAFIPMQIATVQAMRLLEPAPFTNVKAMLQSMMSFQAIGTPQECAAVIADSLAQTKARRCLLVVEGAVDRERTLANMARISAEVLPRLR